MRKWVSVTLGFETLIRICWVGLGGGTSSWPELSPLVGGIQSWGVWSLVENGGGDFVTAIKQGFQTFS